MKIAAWVPIKMNNERLPGKNILPLAGKPLCQHVLGELLKLDGVDGVYVFCSEPEIEQYIQPGVVRIPRSTALNSFSTKINDVILAFSQAVDADIYVYAQVTSPFLKKERIEQGLKAVLSGEYDSALSVKRLRDFLWKEQDKPLNYDPASIARTQDLEPYWQETGGFYIYTKELIRKYNRRTGFKPYFVELSESESVDIDYREDYELAQSMVLKDFGRANDNYNVATLAKWVALSESGRSVNDFFNGLGYKTCAIYGAGVIGSRLYDALRPDGVTVKYFISQSGRGYAGVRCIKPEEAAEQEPVDVIVITPGFDEAAIRKALAGVSAPVVVMDDVLDVAGYCIKTIERSGGGYALGQHHWERVVKDYYSMCGSLQPWLTPSEYGRKAVELYQSILGKSVVLPQLDFIITTKCSLKCRQCFHQIPSYTKDGRAPFDVDLETLKRDLSKLLSAVDYIVKVNILGGEPFLYERIDELLRYLLTCDKVGYFQLITNSTIIPEDSTCELLRNPRFYVHVNDYGVPGSKGEELCGKLHRFGVMHGKANDRVWYDFGCLQKQEFSETERAAHFEKCDYKSCKALMQGELHACALLKHAQRNGLIPPQNDALHIHEYSDEALREALIAFYNAPYFTGCDYCNAPNRFTSRTISAGEQE